MRRILRKIAENEYSSLGDTSTLADPTVVRDLIDNRQNRGTGVRGRGLPVDAVVDRVRQVARG